MAISSTGLSTSDTGLILPSSIESYYIHKRTKIIQIISTPVYKRHWSLVQRLEKWVTLWLTISSLQSHMSTWKCLHRSLGQIGPFLSNILNQMQLQSMHITWWIDELQRIYWFPNINQYFAHSSQFGNGSYMPAYNVKKKPKSYSATEDNVMTIKHSKSSFIHF